MIANIGESKPLASLALSGLSSSKRCKKGKCCLVVLAGFLVMIGLFFCWCFQGGLG